MDSDDYLAPEVYEQSMWPEIAAIERRYRKTDRLFFVTYLVTVLTMTTMVALTPRPWSGCYAGAAVVMAFTAGHVLRGIQGRRAGYRQLESLHKHAELVLLQREVES